MRPSFLRRLNDDVLHQIYEELLPDGSLQPLSLTCKWVRESVKPVLFRSSFTKASGLIRQEFVPRQLWPYIQNLYFYGEWPEMKPSHVDCRDIPFPLPQALSEMPQLTAIYIPHMMDRGVPWAALATILSLPRLRVFEVSDSISRDQPSTIPYFRAAPLTSYRQVMHTYRTSRYSPSDSALLCVILNQSQVHDSLESLEVPSEFFPYTLLVQFHWSRLKRLSLRGENWEHDRPLVELFGGMPALQLVLELAHPKGTDLLRLCPPGWVGSLPWPDLKRLTVAHPDPDDPAYSRLPTTLRHLGLLCWPRHYIYALDESCAAMVDLGWHSPILTSFDMVRILLQCQCVNLDTLDVEFAGAGDHADIELFRLIPSAFPNLSSLTVHRHRPRGAIEVPVREIGEALEPLVHLKLLFLYLDFYDAPHPYGVFNPTYPEEHAQIMKVFEQSADILARSLGPSLAIISFLMRRQSANEWVPYRVYHTNDRASVQLAPGALGNFGMSNDADEGPPFVNRWGAIYYPDPFR